MGRPTRKRRFVFELRRTSSSCPGYCPAACSGPFAVACRCSEHRQPSARTGPASSWRRRRWRSCCRSHPGCRQSRSCHCQIHRSRSCRYRIRQSRRWSRQSRSYRCRNRLSRRWNRQSRSCRCRIRQSRRWNRHLSHRSCCHCHPNQARQLTLHEHYARIPTP